MRGRPRPSLAVASLSAIVSVCHWPFRRAPREQWPRIMQLPARTAAEFLASNPCREGRVGAEYARTMTA